MSGCTDPRLGELLDARVLGACPPEEAHTVDAHVLNCPYCAGRAPGLRGARQALLADVPLVAPGPELRDRVMAQVREDARLFGELRPAPRVAPRHRRRLVAVLTATGVLAATGAIGLLAGTALVEPDRPQQVISAALTPQAGSGARARLVVREDIGRLEVQGMRPPGEGRVYQVWLLRGSGAPRPTDALFGVAGGGSAVVAVPGDLSDTDQVLVTSEPTGGSAAPTRTPVLAVRL
ncbi:MAG: anti-sigma factor [Solirubrobacterales bacterium]|nr:anti-sigma factor [Solirubrobacterales bacterium]